MWKSIEAAPADAILGLTEAFKNDPRPEKVNLGVGVYKDDTGATPILQCVKSAEQLLLDTEQTKNYLPISGDPLYARCVQQLLFGEDNAVVTSGRAVTAHSPGGTGALRIGAELLRAIRPTARVWLSTPTWANHRGIFGAAGFSLSDYPYYDFATSSLRFQEMLAALEQVPAGDIVLLHACCHNPSGVDLGQPQWREVADCSIRKGWIPFVDFAYQGFGSGVVEDRTSVLEFARTGSDFFVASSFSKNFGLYNERTGAITIVCPTSAEADIAMSHLKTTVRVCYSNPPAHGGLIARTVLSDPSLKEAWRAELRQMCNRIKEMRTALVDGLENRGVTQDFSSIRSQNGMFSFSGLSDDVVNWLRENKAIYIVRGGRINVAGLTTGNIDYICDSIAEAVRS